MASPSASASASTRKLEGKVAIITGGASGIGASTVRLSHQHCAKVVIADIQDNLGHALVKELGDDDNVCYIHCDVYDESQVANLVDTTVAKFGRLDIMYSNAGIFGRYVTKSILTIHKEYFENMIHVNLVGAFLAAKQAARVMVPNKKGIIIFTASASTVIASICPSPYAATKHGVVGLMKSLAAELAEDGIRVNSVSPFGVVAGPYANYKTAKALFAVLSNVVGNLKGKVLKAEDVAKAALYLASDDDAGNVSGLNLVVDGGYSVVNPSLRQTCDPKNLVMVLALVCYVLILSFYHCFHAFN